MYVSDLFIFYSIEWNAFDIHSGIDSLHWRLFDNFTMTNVLHGHENLHSQGNAMVSLIYQPNNNINKIVMNLFDTRAHKSVC